MGRRKIAIQKITHERNRSVTFLKRKNGLFKKAYELGVLCSVDVAVIIFETKQGHPTKLFEYSSGDATVIAQRRLNFSGDKDIKGPNDFRNKTGSDGEDDPDDESDHGSQKGDDPQPSRYPQDRGPMSVPIHSEPFRSRSDLPGQPSSSTSRPYPGSSTSDKYRRSSVSIPPDSSHTSYYNYPASHPHGGSHSHRREIHTHGSESGASDPLARLYAGLTSSMSASGGPGPHNQGSNTNTNFSPNYPVGSLYGHGSGTGPQSGGGHGHGGGYTQAELDQIFFAGGGTAAGGHNSSGGSATTQSPTPAPTPPMSSPNSYLFSNAAALQSLSSGFGGRGAGLGGMNPSAAAIAAVAGAGGIGGLGNAGLGGPGGPLNMPGLMGNHPVPFAGGSLANPDVNMNTNALFASLMSQAQSQMQIERERVRRSGHGQVHGNTIDRDRERERETRAGFQWPSTNPPPIGRLHSTSSVSARSGSPGVSPIAQTQAQQQQLASWMEYFMNTANAGGSGSSTIHGAFSGSNSGQSPPVPGTTQSGSTPVSSTREFNDYSDQEYRDLDREVDLYNERGGRRNSERERERGRGERERHSRERERKTPEGVREREEGSSKRTQRQQYREDKGSGSHRKGKGKRRDSGTGEDDMDIDGAKANQGEHAGKDGGSRSSGLNRKSSSGEPEDTKGKEDNGNRRK